MGSWLLKGLIFQDPSGLNLLRQGLGFRVSLDPKELTSFKDLYEEIIIRSPKKGGS